MQKPKSEDFHLKSVKIFNSGGAEIEYSFPYSMGGEGQLREVKHSDTLNIHKDLLDLLMRQKGRILIYEEMNFRLMAGTLEKLGVDHKSEVNQVIAGMEQGAMGIIQPTGIKIHGSGDNEKVSIIYQKKSKDKKIIGRATTPILLSGNIFGFEEELEHDVKDIKQEAYRYVFEEKYSDSDQLSMDFFNITDDEDLDQVDNAPEEKNEKKSKKK